MLLALLCGAVKAEDTAALRLLRQIQQLQNQHGTLSIEQLPPLIELGELYSHGRCEDALEILDLALDVSRRNEGLLNPHQLEIYTPLINCYITLDRPADVRNAQQYVLLINETRYGKQDPELLPALEQIARRYEEAGLYLSARRLQQRALDIAEATSGKNDLSLVTPLRGMARAFRLEYKYGLAAPDVAELSGEYDLASSASFQDRFNVRLDSLGRRSLERAVTILRAHANSSSRAADRTQYLDTLLELADWYQICDQRRADKTYRALWQELSGDGRTEVLDSVEALFVQPKSGGQLLRRPPPDPDRYQQYTVDLDYTVTRDGVAKDITVTESNAPKDLEHRAVEALKQTQFRPRYENGEPVETTGLHNRQSIYGERRAAREVQTAVR
jgi:hypothetical protein